MRVSTVLTLAAVGVAGYFAYKLTSTSTSRQSSSQQARPEPIVMWFETVDERTAFCEGAD